jgi:hypothetical protein
MNRHPLDATALIFGLLFTLAGFAILSEEAWPDLDTTAVVGATVGLLGLVFVAVLVLRQLREGSQPPADEDELAPAEESV